MFKELIFKLRDFITTNHLRKLYNRKKYQGDWLDTIVEFDNGEHAIIPWRVTDHIPHLDRVKRITFYATFEHRKPFMERSRRPEEMEIEFVVCSKD